MASGNAGCDSFNASVAAYLAANPPGTVFMVGTAAAASSPAETLTPGLDATVAALTSKGTNVVVIRVCRGAIGNMFVFLDHNHLSRTYTASMSTALGERLTEAGFV